MFIIMGIMLSGVLFGYLIRDRKIQITHKIITVLVWLLLLLLGIEVGANKEIINNLHTIGLEAIYITIGAVTGSVLAAWGLWYFINRKRPNTKKQ